MSKEKTEDALTHTHLVAYTDGGARPTNPGFAGAGIHAYLCKEKTSKVGSGHPRVSPTKYGYFPKQEVRDFEERYKRSAEGDIAGANHTDLREVDVIAYYDVVCPLGDQVTNNVAEVTAAIKSLKLAQLLNVNSVIIIADSGYMIKGITEWFEGWVARKWRRPDGTEYANRELWEEFSEVEQATRAKGITIAYRQIKGHAGDVGNEASDVLATIGCNQSRSKLTDVTTIESPGKGYWKTEVERHPYLTCGNLYFHTSDAGMVKGRYLCGEHGKDDTLLAVKSTAGMYGIFELKEPDTLLESLRDLAKKKVDHLNRDEDAFMIGRLNEIYRPDFINLFEHFGSDALLQPNPLRATLTNIGTGKESQILTEVRPPLLAWQAVDDMGKLADTFELYKSNDTKLTITDITDGLFETVEEKKKPVTRLRDEFNGGFDKLEVIVKYDIGKGVEETNVILVPGSSILPRNTLKKLEGREPKVKVITWKESDVAFRYAIVIETNDAIGIWAAFYSNFRYLVMTPKKVVSSKSTKKIVNLI